MQQHWNRIWAQIVESDTAFEEFLQNSGLSSSSIKKAGKFIKSWNILKKMAEEFDQFVTPVEPIINILPWETPMFAEKWTFWKEYLQEQHGQIIRSRSEKMSLAYLEQLADSNEENACKIIDFTCYLRAKSFILPPDKKDDNNKEVNDYELG